MKAIALMTGLVLVGVLTMANAAVAESSPSLAGKLVGFDTRTQVVEGFRNSHYEQKTKSDGKKVTDGYSYSGTQTQVIYVLTVEVGDMTYTAEHTRNLIFGYNPTDMVVNDPVNVRVEKNKLIFVRSNGKEYKTTIVRMERNQGRTTSN